MRVYTYARYSTDRQTEASIVDQQRRCHQYAESHAWSVISDFKDEGISGAALGNRPGFQQAMASVHTGDILLVADLTRLSRSQELAPLLDRLRFRGVRVIGVFDGFESDSPQARMQAGLSGLMSDELRASIRARTHSALQMRAENNRSTGGKVYGYDTKGQVIEAEADIVREIFTRTAHGDSMRTIANDLNARGAPSPGATWNRSERRHDGRWLISALNAMLQNERYIGRLVWNKSQWVKDPDSGRRVRRERPESEWTVTECPVLIEATIWARVQVRMKERATGRKDGRGVRRYLLSGLLICERCGCPMVIRGTNGSHYGCSTYMHGGEAACSMGLHLPRKVAEHVVLEPVRSEMLAPDAVERFCDLIRGWARSDSARVGPCADPAIAAIDVEIADIEALIEARPARGATMRPLIEELRTRQANLRRLAQRKVQSAKVADLPGVQSYRAAVADLAEALAGSNVEAARAQLRGLVGTVPVFAEGRKLYGRLGLDRAQLLRSTNPGLLESCGSGGPLRAL
jgi:site-specific DNA recombinase